MDSNTDVKIKKENIKGFAEGIKKKENRGQSGDKRDQWEEKSWPNLFSSRTELWLQKIFLEPVKSESTESVSA